MPAPRLLVLCNANAGGAPRADDLAAYLHDDDIAVDTADLDALDDALRTHDDADRVVAVGGDGTLSTVVARMAALADDRPLGLVPRGTGNDLARTLGLPLTADDPLTGLRTGSIAHLDRLETHDGTTWRTGINASVVGPPAASAEALSDVTKRWLGPLSFLLAGADTLARLAPFEAAVDVDGTRHDLCLHGLVVANGRTVGGGNVVAPEADPADGWLDVTVVRDAPVAALLDLAVRLAADETTDDDLLWRIRCRSLQITADRDLDVNLDGDLITPASASWAWRIQGSAQAFVLP